MFVVIQCFFVNLHRVMKIHTFIYKTYLVKVAARRRQYDKDCSTRALTNVTAPPLFVNLRSQTALCKSPFANKFGINSAHGLQINHVWQ